VTQVLAGLRYNDARLFDLLGGREAMIESPVLQELKNEWTREATRVTKRTDVLEILVIRFGKEAEGLKSELDAIEEPERLQELMKFAVLCADLDAFRGRLAR
jgi:hypothetical protein